MPSRQCCLPPASGLWGWSSAQRAPLMMPSQCGTLWHGRQGADFSVLSLIPNIYIITLPNSLEEEFGVQFKSEFWTIFKRKQPNIPMVETLFTASTVPGLWGGGSKLIPECHIYLYFGVQNIIIFMLVFCHSTLYAFIFFFASCMWNDLQTNPQCWRIGTALSPTEVLGQGPDISCKWSRSCQLRSIAILGYINMEISK